MVRKNKQQAIVDAAQDKAAEAFHDAIAATPTEQEVTEALGETHSMALNKKTVVKSAYKRAYVERAMARGATSKAERRMNGDWLSQELLGECMTGTTFDLARFEAILNANGVKHEHWSRVTNGWQGRIRMSGSVALRACIGRTGVLRKPENDVNVAELAEQGDASARSFLARVGWAPKA